MQDKNFIKNDKVPMTKEEIRYVTMGYLDIQNKANFLDIGSGTGAISIEALVQNKNLQVTAIETDERAYATTIMNIENFEQRYGNIKSRFKLVKAKAPLELNQKFDSIFVGGTKGSVKEIINWSANHLNKDGVIVLNFIVLENFYDATDAIRQNPNLSDIQISQVYINKLENLGRYKYFKPHNPVFIIKAVKIEN